MDDPKSNIVLIGMAGCGKSTVGRMLTGTMSRDFVDTDNMIEQRIGCPLQKFIDTRGSQEFRRVEEEVLLGVNLSKHIIATGGSSIYSNVGMMHLKENGIVVFLDVAFPILEKRVLDLDTRGLVKRPDQNFAELFGERLPLYKKYSDLTVHCGEMDKDAICSAIITLVGSAADSACS